MPTTVIAGAGVIGLACAYSLRRRGEDVILVDRGEPGDGCSRGNAGWIAPSFSTPLPAPGLTVASLLRLLRNDGPLAMAPRALASLAPWLWQFRRFCNVAAFTRGVKALSALNQCTFELFRALAADGVHFEAHEEGVLFAYRSESEIDRAHREFSLLSECGHHPPRALSAPEVRALEPALSEAVIGGYLVEDDMHVRPESLNAALAKRVVAMGVELLVGATVTGATRRSGESMRIETTRGVLRGDRVLVAAGACSAQLCARLGTRLPIQPGKGYSVTLNDPPWTLGRPVYLADSHIACSPFDRAVRFAGTMEFAGIDDRVNRRRLNAFCRAADRYLREAPKWNDGEPWTGLRPITPDRMPLIGRLPGRRDAFVATGHAMLGMTLAPVTGEIIARLIVDGQARARTAAFDPARFVG